MRKRIFEIIEIAGDNDRLSKTYDITMMIVIVLSLVPIATKNSGRLAGNVELVTTVIFVVDYIFFNSFQLNRLITAAISRAEAGVMGAAMGRLTISSASCSVTGSGPCAKSW